MKRLLTYANYQKVANALKVSRASVSEWSRGIDVTPYRLDEVRALMQSVVGRRRKAPPAEADGAAPEWAGRLERMIEAIAVASGIPRASLKEVEALEQYVLELERLQQLPDAKRRKANPPVQGG